jgi:phage terminase large subunit-like protein
MERTLTYAEIATQYARDVVDGRIPSCKWHRLACTRHLHDLERAGTDAFPYLFNPELTDANGKTYRPAERICRFGELMPHIKGDWAARGQLIVLEAWQIFILVSIFGWVRRETFKRRFRVADLYVPRKNAKSTLAALIGLYMLALDDEFGAEVYSGATSLAQALEVFRPALLMAKATPRFLQTYGVSAMASNIAVIDKNSKFEPIIGKPGDGASPSCAVVDEYHEHQTPELYDTMQTGMGARSQPLILVITTAGTDISGPCFQHQNALEKILEGTLINEQRFGIVFTIDDGDDWTRENALRKANPNFGISIDAEYLIHQQRDAKDDPTKQNNFKTKHLNIWCQAASPWLNLYHLQQCGDSSLTLESFRAEECIVGLDLASREDIASKVYLFRRYIDDVVHYYAISRNYIPESLLGMPENAHYQGWVNSGHLIATPGNMTDLSLIEEDLIESASIVVLREIAKDQYNSAQLGSNLALSGFEVVDIPQHVRYLSEPMHELKALVNAGRFHHDGNPAFVWMLSNVEVKPDRNENIFPRKLRNSNKIDAATALIIAMNRALAAAPANAKSFWETETA